MAGAEQGRVRDEGTNRVDDSQGAEQDGGHCRGQNRVEGTAQGMERHVRAGQDRAEKGNIGQGEAWYGTGAEAWADSAQGRTGRW